MKAISICQPFASAIVYGYEQDGERRFQRLVNRKNHTNGWWRYTGPVVVHASKNREWLDGGTWNRPLPDPMPFGQVLGVAEMYGSLPISRIMSGDLTGSLSWLAHDEHVIGPRVILLRNVRALKEPMDWRGFHLLWDFPDEVAQGFVFEEPNRHEAQEHQEGSAAGFPGVIPAC